MSVSRLCRAYWSNVCAFIPVIVFLAYGRFGFGEAAGRWETAYLVGGFLGLGHLFWLRKHRPGHWIALGVDLYLLIGALLAVLSTSALQAWGQSLGAAPVLACTLVVGLGANGWLSLGLSGHALDSAPRQCSPMLLMTNSLAVIVALFFRHSLLIGGVLPILALVLMRSQMLKRQAAQ
ncbi:permease [Pseudomonas chlororaphis]|jgi:hypothetical protein|uniref:permease n=1 Tax=Pseudomonas chlororaphis TaxID=587753 RepID=UPI0015E02D4E|nr:permease [Pseudomonas chlororaphis]QLL12568.1 permease [Pseudomonas chlororaphis subsp. aurantiaca]